MIPESLLYVAAAGGAVGSFAVWILIAKDVRGERARRKEAESIAASLQQVRDIRSQLAGLGPSESSERTLTQSKCESSLFELRQVVQPLDVSAKQLIYLRPDLFEELAALAVSDAGSSATSISAKSE